MEARKRKTEERKIGVGRHDGRGKKNETTEGRENAHANGKGFTAKVSRGNEQNVRTNEQTNPSIDRSGTGGLVPSPSFFLLSSAKSRSGDCASRWKPKVAA